MRIEQGYIFRPENPNEIKDSVRLEISDSKIELEYTEDSSDIYDYCKIGIILGVFNRIGNVTFLDCNLSGNSIGGGANIRRISADLMLEGVHISNWQQLKFSKCVVNIPSLYDWVGISVLKNRLWTEKKMYTEIPDDILLATFEKYQLFFSFGYYSRFAQNEIHLKQYTSLKVVALQDYMHLSEFLEIVTHFKKFLLLIANKSHISDSITFYNNKYKYGDDEGFIPMELVTNSNSQNKIQLSISAVVIEYKELQNNFEEILKTWFENKNLYSSIDLVIEKFLNPNLSRENDFLNSCFAIETYHRRFKKVEVINKSEHCCPEKFYQKLSCSVSSPSGAFTESDG